MKSPGTPDKPGIIYSFPDGKSLEEVKVDFRNAAKKLKMPYRLMQGGSEIERSSDFSPWQRGVTFYLDERS